MCAILARMALRGAAQKSRSAKIRQMATSIHVAINALVRAAVHWRIVLNNALSVPTEVDLMKVFASHRVTLEGEDGLMATPRFFG